VRLWLNWDDATWVTTTQLPARPGCLDRPFTAVQADNQQSPYFPVLGPRHGQRLELAGGLAVLPETDISFRLGDDRDPVHILQADDLRACD